MARPKPTAGQPSTVRKYARRSRIEHRNDPLFDPLYDLDVSDYASPIDQTFALQPLERLLGQFTRVVLYARVSTGPQSKTLPAQKEDLVSIARKHGLTVIKKIPEIGNGGNCRRPKLVRAIQCAKKHGAFVLATDAFRYLRPAKFDRLDPSRQASDGAWLALAREAGSTPLATALSPNATSSEIKSYETKRGRAWRGKVGGRPQKSPYVGKRKTDGQKQEIVAAFKKWSGSMNDFCTEHHVSKKSIKPWLKKFG